MGQPTPPIPAPHTCAPLLRGSPPAGCRTAGTRWLLPAPGWLAVWTVSGSQSGRRPPTARLTAPRHPLPLLPAPLPPCASARGRGSPRTPRPVDHQLLPGPAPGPVPPARYPAPGSEVEARGHPSSCLTPGIEDVPQLPALRPCHPQHCSVPLPLTVHTCVHTVCTCTAKTYTHNVHEHTDTCMLHAEVHMCSRAYTHVQPLPPLRCHPAWPAQSKHVVGTAGRPTCLSSSLSFCSSQARPGSEGRSSEPCSLASWGWVP